MIIRKLSQSLKDQNWTAIWIEFLLLAAGVFLGIQGSNWNDARTERALEAVYQERIEIQPAPAYSDADPNSPGIALFILSTLDGNRSAYETVINTGGIAAMADDRMLRKIQDYYALVDKALHFEVGLEQNRDKLIDAERRIKLMREPQQAATVLANELQHGAGPRSRSDA